MLLLELAWAAQVAACVAYAYDFFMGGAARLARFLIASAWALLGGMVIYRWHSAGLAQPPWLSMTEVLIFASWALLSVQLLSEWRLRTHVAGFFCAALAASACGAVILTPLGLVPFAATALDPAFRNPLAWIHVPSGVFGYSLFLFSAFFAAIGLIRAEIRSDRFLCVLAALTLLLLSGVLPALNLPDLLNGPWKDPAGAVAVSCFSLFLLASAVELWLESLDLRLHSERLRRQPEMAAKLGRGPVERTLFKRLLLLGFAVSWIVSCIAIYRDTPGLAPYPFVALVFLSVLNGAALALALGRKAIEQRLPEREHFDRWSYQSSLYAFPWLTIHLVSGSVWAYDAWGSFWSWQPQQGWVAIAWFYVALILHLEHGKVSTAVATCAGALLVGAAIGTAGAHAFWPVIQ